jgi:MFS transporter, ACS family, tartrate transporter
MAAIPMSFVIGSPIAGLILGHSWFSVEGWRWLFIVEGIPAILLGGVAFFFLTDWPVEANWLAPEQRSWIRQKLEEEKPATRQAMNLGQALRSRIVLLLALSTFLNYFVLYSFAFWFPTMLKRQSTLSDARVGVLGALPYLVIIAMQINGWHSDKSGERRWHAAIPLFVAAAGALGLLAQPPSLALSLLCFTLVCTSFAYLPVFWAIPTENLSQSWAAGAIGMINSVGSVAGFVGPYVFGYLGTRTGSFGYSLVLVMVAAFAGGLLTLCTPRRVPVTVGSTAPR